MRMQLFRTNFRKSCMLLAKNWIKSFPGKNPVKLRGKIWICHQLLYLLPMLIALGLWASQGSQSASKMWAIQGPQDSWGEIMESITI